MDQTTRDRLLECAAEAFAERGYHQTTIRSMCTQAEANVAAVNYYFQGKDDLYMQVVELAHRNSALSGDGDDAESGIASEDRLRAFIREQFEAIFDQGRRAWFGRIMLHEMVQPSPLFDQLVERFIRPRSIRLRAVLQALTGMDPDEPSLDRIQLSIIGQCLVYHRARRVIDLLFPYPDRGAPDIEGLVEHTVRFSLAGMRAVLSGGGGEAGA